MILYRYALSKMSNVKPVFITAQLQFTTSHLGSDSILGPDNNFAEIGQEYIDPVKAFVI